MSFGAIFDWDGVIIDSSAQHERSWELLAEELGKSLPEGHFKRGFGKKNERIIPDLGWATDADEIHQIGLRKEEFYRQLVSRDGVTPLPGARELLTVLQDAGIPCVVGSSTHRANIETICEITGLGGFFAGMVTGEDVSHGKPDPEVFRRGAEIIGIDPARCIVFEDALVGLEAARAGGMKCVGVATTEPLAALEGKADLAVESLTILTLEQLSGLVG
ncbi:MAG: HAD family phosphatase [Chthoniobacterales bacterium]